MTAQPPPLEKTWTDDEPYFVVDSDSHILEPPHLWEEYLEAEFRDRAIRITTRTAGLDGRETVPGARAPDSDELPEMALEIGRRLGVGEALVIDRQVVMSGSLAGLGGVYSDRSKLPQMTYLEGAPRGSMDGAARMEIFREWGVQAGACFPTIGILWDTEDPQLADAYCRAYNRWLHEEFVDGRKGLIPIAHIPFHDPDLALKELRRCLALGFRGVFVAPERVLGRSPADAEFDPIWHELEDAGYPFCLHVIVRFNRLVNTPAAPWNLLSRRSITHGFAFGATWQVIPAVTSLVMSGLFDRFPRLKCLCVEAGSGWAAYVMDRLDEKYEHFSFADDLKMWPSEYFKRNVHYVVEPRERTINSMMDLVGEDKFLWGSDWPHIDSSPLAPKQIRDSVGDLSEDRKKLVLGENARALYQLGDNF